MPDSANPQREGGGLQILFANIEKPSPLPIMFSGQLLSGYSNILMGDQMIAALPASMPTMTMHEFLVVPLYHSYMCMYDCHTTAVMKCFS